MNSVAAVQLFRQKMSESLLFVQRHYLERGRLLLYFKITSSSGHSSWLTCLSKKQCTATSGQTNHTFSQISGIHTADIMWEIEKQMESALNRTVLRET